jgi:rubrerythrin
MSDQTERMEDALRRVIREKIAAEGEAERLRAALAERDLCQRCGHVSTDDGCVVCGHKRALVGTEGKDG